MSWDAADAMSEISDTDRRVSTIVDTPSWKSYVLNGADLDATVFPPLRWAVDGLIPEGFGLLTGPPKAGKSWLVGGLALAVASGGKALGKVPVREPRPVLYLALEDGPRRLQGRCRVLLGEGVPIPPLLDFVTQTHGIGSVNLISDWLTENGHRAPLVVLDTLGKVMPDAKPGESAYSRDYRIGSSLKAVIDAHPGSTLIAVHHVRKAAGEDWMDSTSGTNGLNGAADFTLNISRQRNSDAGILRVTGRDVVENEYAVTTDSGRWSLDGQALADAAQKAEIEKQTAGLGDRSSQIVNWIEQQKCSVTPKEVEAALGIPDAAVYLKRLVERGSIDKLQRGLYASVTSVRSVSLEGVSSDTPDGYDTSSGEVA